MHGLLPRRLAGEDGDAGGVLGGAPEEPAVAGARPALAGGALQDERLPRPAGQRERDVQPPRARDAAGGEGALLGGQDGAVRADPVEALRVAAVDRPERAAPLPPVVGQHPRAFTWHVGGAAPEVGPVDVGDRDARPEVVDVVVRPGLGDDRPAEGADGVQMGPGRVGGLQVAALDVVGDVLPVHPQPRPRPRRLDRAEAAGEAQLGQGGEVLGRAHGEVLDAG